MVVLFFYIVILMIRSIRKNTLRAVLSKKTLHPRYTIKQLVKYSTMNMIKIICHVKIYFNPNQAVPQIIIISVLKDLRLGFAKQNERTKERQGVR